MITLRGIKGVEKGVQERAGYKSKDRRDRGQKLEALATIAKPIDPLVLPKAMKYHDLLSYPIRIH